MWIIAKFYWWSKVGLLRFFFLLLENGWNNDDENKALKEVQLQGGVTIITLSTQLEKLEIVLQNEQY